MPTGTPAAVPSASWCAVRIAWCLSTHTTRARCERGLAYQCTPALPGQQTKRQHRLDKLSSEVKNGLLVISVLTGCHSTTLD